ncbi:hypothetical protein [Burkholderia cenocepacia]|uniref:hypothetical protein n=1 Tax=Burkholderia cenocepacia TaxID=95486 RepID=UPI000761AF13|nr:hypothetical protein [Burkholderia cenocepacia]KWU26373.1 hypothetical protein AS149_25630 [Burkholderia cenocepacia]
MNIRATMHAQIRLNNTGELVALSLGYHPNVRGERRPAALQALLCSPAHTKQQIMGMAHAGAPIPKTPNLLEAARLTRNLMNVHYVEYGSYNPKGMLYFAPTFDMARFNGQLEFEDSSAPGADVNVAASCCDEGFAIVVRGESYIKALRGFHSAIINRRVVFADAFMVDEKFGGIVFADESLISDVDRAAIALQQHLSEELLQRELATVPA